jgi:predicted DNA repair protein MutK
VEVLSVIAIMFCLLLLGGMYVCLDEIDKLHKRLEDKTKDEEFVRKTLQKTLIIQQRLVNDMSEMSMRIKGRMKGE